MGGEEAVTPDTIFQAASISKLVTAMVACALVEAGTLDLDADVNTLLRSWQIPKSKHTRERKVTLRGLLSHSAGLGIKGYRGYTPDREIPTLLQILNGEAKYSEVARKYFPDGLPAAPAQGKRTTGSWAPTTR